MVKTLQFTSVFGNSFAMSAVGFMLILSLAISGCAPAAAPEALTVYALQPETTARIIMAGLNASEGARVFVKGDLVMIAKPLAGGWGFVCLDCAGGDPILNLVRTAGGRGNYTSPSAFSWLASSLKESGWTEVKNVGKEIPPTLLAWKTAAEFAGEKIVDTAEIIAKVAKTAMISVLVVPAGALVPPDYIQGDPIQY